MNDMRETVAPRGVTDPDRFESIPEFLRRLPMPAQDTPSAVGEVSEPAGSRPAPLNGSDNKEQAIDRFFQRDESQASRGASLIGASGAADEAVAPFVSPGASPPLIPTVNDLKEAEELASRIVTCLRTRNGAVIQAGRLVYEAVIRFRRDRVAFNRFIDVLVESNVLTKGDGRLRERAPKLSKLYKIGQCADILERQDIAGVLPDGLSVLYQTAVLLEAQPGDENARTEKLIELIRDGQAAQELSRGYLEQLTKAAKQAARPKKPTLVTDKGSETPVYADRVVPFDFFLLTPSEEDVRRLDQDIANESSLPVCRRLNEISADEAVTLSIVPFIAVPTLVKRVLDECGFRVSKTYLVRQPLSADVTDVPVIVVAERGKDAAIQMPDGDWLSDDLVADMVALAERVSPKESNRLHVFGDQSSCGWSALVGEDNWTVGGVNE